jgi:LysM repeat protein
MSALAWDPTDLGYAGSSAPRRPHLVVVSGAARTASDAGSVRLTRRGRLALLLLVLAVAAVLSLTGLRGAGASEPLRSVTVAPGQTLSQIALAELPTMSISQGIVAIQMANDLSTAQVSAGQQLVIPGS